MKPSEEKNVGSKVGYSEKKCISLEDIDISVSILTISKVVTYHAVFNVKYSPRYITFFP